MLGFQRNTLHRTVYLVCLLPFLATPALAQGTGGSSEPTVRARSEAFVQELVAARDAQTQADGFARRIAEAAKRKTSGTELEVIAQQRNASLAKASASRELALGTLWPAIVQAIEGALSAPALADLQPLFDTATAGFSEMQLAVQRIELLNALPSEALSKLQADSGSVRRRLNISLLKAVGTTCPASSTWPSIDAWASQAAVEPLATPGGPSGDSSWGELRQRCILRAIEPVCQGFARAVAKQDLQTVLRLFPDSDPTQWKAFFDQYEVLNGWPANDVRIETSTRASCAFSIVVADRRLLKQNRSAASVNAQQIRYSLQLAAQGDTWFVKLVTGA